MTTDTVLSALILLGLWVALMGPMLWLLWRQLRRFLQAMVVLRDRIDRSQRH